MGIAQTALGMVSQKKVAVLLDFVQITSPQFGQLFHSFIWNTCMRKMIDKVKISIWNI